MAHSPTVMHQGNRVIIEVESARAEELQARLQEHGIHTAILKGERSETLFEVVSVGSQSVETSLTQFGLPRPHFPSADK